MTALLEHRLALPRQSWRQMSEAGSLLTTPFEAVSGVAREAAAAARPICCYCLAVRKCHFKIGGGIYLSLLKIARKPKTKRTLWKIWNFIS